MKYAFNTWAYSSFPAWLPSYPLDEAIRRKDCLDQIASHADEKGITIVVEPTAAATNLIETADDAMELMRSVARDNVKVMFDTLHALYRNEIPADYVRAMREDLVHIHLSDSDRVIPGEGRVDWIGLMRALNEVRV